MRMGTTKRAMKTTMTTTTTVTTTTTTMLTWLEAYVEYAKRKSYAICI